MSVGYIDNFITFVLLITQVNAVCFFTNLYTIFIYSLRKVCLSPQMCLSISLASQNS